MHLSHMESGMLFTSPFLDLLSVWHLLRQQTESCQKKMTKWGAKFWMKIVMVATNPVLGRLSYCNPWAASNQCNRLTTAKQSLCFLSLLFSFLGQGSVSLQPEPVL